MSHRLTYREWLAEYLNKEVEEITPLDFDGDSHRLYLDSLYDRRVKDRMDDITSKWDAEVN